MSGLECVAVLIGGTVLYCIATWYYIRADNKPRPRWPGDP